MKIRPKNLICPVAPFKGTQVTGTDTDKLATYDFLLMFRSNYEPVRDKQRLRLKIAKFLHPPHHHHQCVFSAPTKGFLLETKTIVMPLLGGKKEFDDSFRYNIKM